MSVRVDAGAETVHWGYFDAALPPIVTIDSGDTVTISTVSGPPDVMPGPPYKIPPALPATSSTAEPHPGGAPREYSREQILIEAAVYIVGNGLPEKQTKLRDEIALILGNRSPGDTQLGQILRPLYKRIAEELGRK